MTHMKYKAKPAGVDSIGIDQIIGSSSATCDHQVHLLIKAATLENPRCCSKLCRFGGRTGLWVPRPLHTRDATRLHAGARRHIYEATTPQKRVADHIGTHLLATPEYFVVCCQMCSQDVETAIRISKRCRLEIIFTKYGPGDFGSGDVQKPKIVLGVDELVLPTDGPPDSSDGNDGSETDVEVMAAMAAMEAMEARQM